MKYKYEWHKKEKEITFCFIFISTIIPTNNNIRLRNRAAFEVLELIIELLRNSAIE